MGHGEEIAYQTQRPITFEWIHVRIHPYRGPQFISQLWKESCSPLGALVSLTSSYHPQSNGQTEHLNQKLETCLRCLVSQNLATWSKHLLWVEYAHLTFPSSASDLSPFQCAYSYQPPLFPALEPEVVVSSDQVLVRRCRCIWTWSRQVLRRPINKRTVDRKRVPAPVYQPGEREWVSTRDVPLRMESRKLAPWFCGPLPHLQSGQPCGGPSPTPQISPGPPHFPRGTCQTGQGKSFGPCLQTPSIPPGSLKVAQCTLLKVSWQSVDVVVANSTSSPGVMDLKRGRRCLPATSWTLTSFKIFITSTLTNLGRSVPSLEVGVLLRLILYVSLVLSCFMFYVCTFPVIFCSTYLSSRFGHFTSCPCVFPASLITCIALIRFTCPSLSTHLVYLVSVLPALCASSSLSFVSNVPAVSLCL